MGVRRGRSEREREILGEIERERKEDRVRKRARESE